MGSGCTKSGENQVMQPQNNLEIAINTEFTPFLRIDHPFNVNHKYSSFCSYLKNEFAGQGIKKTHAYRSKLTREELDKKRDEFWETRVEGVQTSWQILRKAVDSPEKESITYLAAGGLKLVNKSIQIAYDESGHKYDIPIFCINDPQNFETVPSHERNIVKEFEEITVTVTIRCTKLNNDLVIKDIKTSQTVQDLKQIFNENSKKNFVKIRFFLSGKEMHDHHQLGNYTNEYESKVIQAYAFEQNTQPKNSE